MGSLPAVLVALSAGVEMHVVPAHLRLGADDRAEVRIEGAPGPLRVRCSAGRLEELREIAAGSWVATYLPPSERVPRVALIVARTADAVGVTAVPLWGAGDAEIRTHPGGVANVRIGDTVYGPFRAGRDGRTSVPVVVPPGVDFAFQGTRAIDLHVPRTRTVQIAPIEDEMQVDRAREIEVAVAAVTRDGASFDGPLQLAASAGEVEILGRLAPGLHRVLWRIPSGPPGTATLRATVAGDPEPSAEEVRLVAGPVSRLELSPGSASAHAGDGTIDLIARAWDLAGNPADEPLGFESNAGGAVAAVRIGPGEYRAQVEVPERIGAGVLRVAAAPRGRTEPAAAAEIELLPAAAAKIDLVPERNAVRADGASPVRLQVTLRDRFGNEVPQPPDLTASAGSVSAPIPDGRRFVAVYVPPRRKQPGDAVVSVRAAGVEGSAHLELLPEMRNLALAPKVGFLTDFHSLHGPLVGAEAALRTHWGRLQVAGVLGLAFATSSESGSVATGGAPAAFHARDELLVASAAVALRWPASDRTTLWLQAGGVIVAASVRVQVGSAGDPLRSDTTSRGAVPGIELGAGVERRMWGGVPFVEAAWLATRPFALPNLEGALLSVSLRAGYRFELM